MSFNHNKLLYSKRLGTWMLILFVVSWTNMSLQVPAHAAMQQSMDMTQVAMDSMDMEQCHCPPALCDTVLSLDNQSTDGALSSSSLYPMLAFQALTVQRLSDPHHLQVSLRFSRSDWRYRQISPPPISLTSILLI